MISPAPWYAPLERLESKGSKVDPVGGLAGLAAARAEHQGQFFTPLALVAFMWRVVGLFAEDARGLTLFDNSFGSGRMFAFADPRKHSLFGVEVDRALGEQVQQVTEGARFSRQLMLDSLDEYRRSSSARFDVGLVNPPFSLTLDTPYVEAFHESSNSYGRFGPQSSVLSHVYAVEQALEWCKYVCAVVPKSFADGVLGTSEEWARFRTGLRAVYTVPRSAFVGEGANVETCVCVWGRDNPVAVRVQVKTSCGTGKATSTSRTSSRSLTPRSRSMTS